MRRGAVLIVMCAAALGSSAGTRDHATAAARRALDTLVRRATHELPLTGPSLTRCVADLISCGDKDVRAVLEEFWERARDVDSAAWGVAEYVESLVRLMYGAPNGEVPLGGVFADFRVFEGAILDAEADSGEYDGPSYRPELPCLRELLAHRILRPAPSPHAELLLRAIRKGVGKDWSSTEKEGLYAALGEAAADKPEVVGGLVKLYRAAPEDEYLALALGHANTPACRDALLAGVVRAARRLAAGTLTEQEAFELRWRLRRISEQLAAVAPDRVQATVAKATGAFRQKLLELMGLPFSVPLLLAEFDAAKTKKERLATWRSLRDVILSQDGAQYARARDVPRLLRLFLSLAPQLPEEERLHLWRAAESLFYAHTRYPIRSSFATGEIAISEQGNSIGPYPDMETIARRMAEDLAAGRLGFIDRWKMPGIFAPSTRRLGSHTDRAHSEFGPPPSFSEPSPGFPVFASAKWTAAGIEVTLTNTGSEPFLVSPLMARYARAEVTCVRRREGGKEESYRQLLLDLGFILPPTAVPRKALIRVDAGKSYSWTQAVRKEHRDVDHVVIRMTSTPSILGGTDLPYLASLNDTWIR